MARLRSKLAASTWQRFESPAGRSPHGAKKPDVQDHVGAVGHEGADRAVRSGRYDRCVRGRRAVLRVQRRASGWPVGQSVRKPSGPLGTTVVLSE